MIPAWEEHVSDEIDNRNAPLANRQPITQCSYQQRERQQIDALVLRPDRPVVHDGRNGILLRRPGSQCGGPETQEHLPEHQAYHGSSGPLRCCR